MLLNPALKAGRACWKSIPVLSLALAAHAQLPTIITTIAGGGPPDNVLGTTSVFSTPTGVLLDGAGNLLICDKFDHRIRKLDRHGVITTVVGNGIQAFSGDGGPALAASLNQPDGIALDSGGSLFIADFGNARIRKVSANGIISTVAGNGFSNFSGDGGPATNAGMDPTGLVMDGGGDIFIADTANQRIRKVDIHGIITTVAGNGTQGFSGDGGPATNATLNDPGGVTVDGAGNLFIADSRNNRIRKVDASGTITTVAGNGSFTFSGDGGPAVNAGLNFPVGVTVDSAGNLLIVDTWSVRKVDNVGIISTVAGNGTIGFSGDGGPATAAQVNFAASVAVDSSGAIVIADTGNDRLRRVDSTKTINTIAGGAGTPTFAGDGGAATSALLFAPEGIATDSAGNILFTDAPRIRRIGLAATITTVAGSSVVLSPPVNGSPATSTGLASPSGLATDSHGDFFIADPGFESIFKVDANGIITTVAGGNPFGFSGDNGPAVQARLNLPSDVAVDSAGDLFIADTKNSRVRRVDTNGIITTVAGNGAATFSGDNGPAVNASLNMPTGVAVDRSDNLFIADSFNNRVRKVNSNGIITTIAGNGNASFSGDGGPATSAGLSAEKVVVDASGNVLIADSANNRVRKVDTNAIITTVAGNGNEGFSGDGGPATGATLYNPVGLAVDTAGNILIGDLFNHRVRQVGTLPLAYPQNVAAEGLLPVTIALHGASPLGAVPLTFAVVGDPHNGSLANFSPSAGTVTYVQNVGFAGVDSFTFKVNDGHADSTPGTVRITVTDRSNFSIAASPPSGTVKAGQSATFTLTVTPQNGFFGSISFVCSGLPALSSCTFSPASITPNGNPATVTLVVKTSGPNAALNVPQLPLGRGQRLRPALSMWVGGLMGTLGILVAAGRRRNGHGSRQRVALLGSMLLLAIVGCGGGTNASPPPPPPATPPGISAVTVTASSSDGSVVNIAGITLTVTQ